MNIIKKLLINCFVVLSTAFFSQNSKAVMEIRYETKLIPDSLNKKNIQQYEAILLCNASESVYFSRDAKEYYSILSGKKENSGTDVIRTALGAIPKYPRNNSSIYKANGKLTAFMPVGKYIFSFEEPELKWEVLNETKEIKGFKCRLAKTRTDTGNEFFAWYTEDIAIPEGPFRFKGLSGMILEIYNKSRTIEIYATDIQKSEELIEPIPYASTVKAKNKMQYLDARKNYTDNPSAYNGNIRLFDASGKEITGNIKKGLQKINVFFD
ncbi:GLPGLI family protein [Chryseobacterium sp. MIQD13]|uniref:GLPGLI family protein n=1 Tax=Chryseobacterium sp. MIQD13 TaxID=3422310 RepID=UPI003D27EF80